MFHRCLNKHTVCPIAYTDNLLNRLDLPLRNVNVLT